MPWLVCDVKRVGPGGPTKTYIALTDHAGSFRNRWFEAADARKEEMLDTALTALSNNFKVQVLLSDTAAYSEIQRLYAGSW